MAELVATIGLQASGKTSWAREWVKEDPVNRVRVERDELRKMLGFGFVKENERQLLDVRNQVIETFLKTGKSVVSSDTNLSWRTLRDLRSLARRNNAEFRTVDLTDVPLSELFHRDENRENRVGAQVIQDFYNRYLGGKSYPFPLPPEDAEDSWDPYVADPTKDPAVIVDIDGTLAKMQGRSPYDWNRVFEDRVNEPVANHVRDLFVNYRVILLSGRDGAARGETVRWLDFHEIPYDELYMRAEGDKTRDDKVKYDLFNWHVRDRFNVLYVLDDRDQVVKMWRELGLACWQVEYGAF